MILRDAAARDLPAIVALIADDGSARACEDDCTLVQLTSTATRHAAHRFYERLCFDRSHVGTKRHLRD